MKSAISEDATPRAGLPATGDVRGSQLGLDVFVARPVGGGMLVLGQRRLSAAQIRDGRVTPPRRSVGLVVVMVASGDEHPGPACPAGPALQLGGQGLGDAQLGKHDDARAVCDGCADQPVYLPMLFLFILRADREGPSEGVREVELSQGAVGMAGCHDGVAIYDPR